ncbi:MAG: SusC/RagA family TonB-linked outer membrane protein [Chitinophagaceae bacterium]|nr:SusC/RagA family TonB-linked outer membrane protein [Chitinophagaceae bacterium]
MQKLKKAFLLMTLFLLAGSTTLLFAQQTRVITGIVKDDKGNSLAGATVSAKGSTTSVVTDENGRYSITVSGKNAILIISSIGFAEKEISVGNANELNVELVTSEGEMSEVVVTALGIKRSPRSLGYAAQKVDGKDLTIAQAPTIAQGLMGKVSGLNISQASGGVEGGSSRLVIRGNTNLTGDNRALIVVDGVPINNTPLNGSTLGTKLNEDIATYNDWGTGLNFINSEDIDNITVLKGPAAAALYGNRGANGVILITRKKGTQRKGLGVDYSFNDRFSSVYNDFFNFQNEYGAGFISSLWTGDNDKRFDVNGNGKRVQIPNYGPDQVGVYTKGAHGMLPYDNATVAWPFISFPGALSWGPKFDDRPILWYDGVERPYSGHPNAWKMFFPNGFTSQHNVSVSGGGEIGTFRLSYTREDNKANVLNSKYNSNVVNLGSTIKISPKLTTDISASYVSYKRLNTPPIGNTYLQGMFYAAPRDYNPEVDLGNTYNTDGSLKDVTNSSNFPAGSPAYPYNGNSYLQNAFWYIYKNNTELNRKNFIGSVKLTATPTSWLTLTGQAGIDNSNDRVETKFYPRDAQGIAGGKYAVRSDRNNTLNMLGMARFYKDNIADKGINVSFTAGGESVNVKNYANSLSTRGNFINPFLFNLKNGSEPVNVNDDIVDLPFAYKINSVIGIVDFSYKNQLFLQVTGRNDWTSTLMSPYNSFFYPAMSLAYVFTDGISGLKDAAPWLSYGKVAVSYAGRGSGTDPYATNAIIDGIGYNGTVAQSFQNILTDPRIKPQRTRQYEASLNLGLFNNKLNLELTGYAGTASPQIVETGLPISSGVNSIRINDAKLSSKGFEFFINANPVSTRNFSWNITVNGSRATNKLESLSGVDSVLTIASVYGTSGVLQKVRVGDNYGTIYGKDFTYHQNGQRIVKQSIGADGQVMIYTTPDGQEHVAATEWVLTPNEVPIGNSIPKLTGGIANTFRYQNFSLYFLTDFKWGGDTWFGSYSSAMGNGLRQETVKERNGGGLPYTYPDGTTGNVGMIMEGVYADGKPNDVVVPATWYYGISYASWNHLGVPRSLSVFENSWMKLREVNLTYQFPGSVVKKTHIFQNLSFSLIGRDLFYIFTTIPKGLNPEGVNGIGNAQGLENSSMPNFRSFGFSVRASF